MEQNPWYNIPLFYGQIFPRRPLIPCYKSGPSCPKVKLINKMNSGAGALKVEGSVVQKLIIASEVSMVTKRAPTTQHCHTEEVQWPYLPQPLLTYVRVEGVGAETSRYLKLWIYNDPQRSAKQSRQSWDMQSLVSLNRLSRHPAQAYLPWAHPLTG